MNVDHLNPDTLARAQRHLVAKAIAEFCHERLLAPRWSRGELASLDATDRPAGHTTYTFAARRLALDHWALDAGILQRHVKDEPADARRAGLRRGVRRAARHPRARCCRPTSRSSPARSRAPRLEAAPQDRPVDRARRRRLPGDRGRDDRGPSRVRRQQRPDRLRARRLRGVRPRDRQSTVRLVWLAARREHTRLSLARAAARPTTTPASSTTRPAPASSSRLRRPRPRPRRLPLPARCTRGSGGNKVAITFAPDLARRDLVLLGEGPDQLPRAAVDPHLLQRQRTRSGSYMKTALAIQNMGFLRGLSPAYMGADAGDQRLGGRRSSRPTRRCVAAGSGYCASTRRSATPATRSTGCGRHTGVSSPHQKMLAALWRESPVPRLADGERLATMASLLHRDAAGRAAGGGAGRRSRGRARRRGCAATCTPTCDPSRTACSPTTWRSCRTARTSCSCCATGCRCGR